MENKELIVKVFDEKELPKKKVKRQSKVKHVLRTLYDSVEPGKVAQFDAENAGVSPHSLRAELRSAIKEGHYSEDTKILSRGKEWFFVRGKEK